jgi:hypothetical protein
VRLKKQEIISLRISFSRKELVKLIKDRDFICLTNRPFHVMCGFEIGEKNNLFHVISLKIEKKRIINNLWT